MSLLLSIFGTRPEIIKLAPVIRACEKAGLSNSNFYTGQQPDLAEQILRRFDIRITHKASVMRPEQPLSALLACALRSIDQVLAASQYGTVIVQGDTTSALAGAMCASFHKIPVVHIEAGLRSGDDLAPFPEETNRRLIAQLASLHCAPTSENVRNLLDEGIDSTAIVETGNPIVSAVSTMLASGLPSPATVDLLERYADKKLIVATAHRRENFDGKLDQYLRALNEYVHAHHETALIFAVHPNPNVGSAVRRNLVPMERLIVTPSLDYLDFLNVLKRAAVIVSDSGGIQEEAASVGTPILVLRSTTERPEAIAANIARLVPQAEHLAYELNQLLFQSASEGVQQCPNPFGDDDSPDRIATAIRERFAGS